VSFAFGTYRVDNLTTKVADSDLGFLGSVKADPGGLATRGTNKSNARNGERTRKGDNLARFVALGLDVFFVKVDTFNENCVILRIHFKDFTTTALVLACFNLNGVVDFELIHNLY